MKKKKKETAKAWYKRTCKIIEKAFREGRKMNYGDAIFKHICLNCGRKMTHAVDFITKKKSKYLFKCKCHPNLRICIG